MAALSESASPERRALGQANAVLAEAQAEPRKVEAAWDKLSEMAYSRRSEIERLKEEIAAGEAAHREYRIREVMDEAAGSPPASLEPLRQALGKAEDDLAILEEAVEARRSDCGRVQRGICLLAPHVAVPDLRRAAALDGDSARQ